MSGGTKLISLLIKSWRRDFFKKNHYLQLHPMWPGITKAISHTHKHHYKSPNVHEIEKNKKHLRSTVII